MSFKVGFLGYYNLVGICICTLACFACYNAMRISVNTGRIDAIEDLYHRSADRWTGSDHRRWAAELQRRNTTIDVPSVEHEAAGN